MDGRVQKMALPYNWRITKYNPKFRDSQGNYRAAEWTSFFDVGQSHTNNQLSYDNYLSVESAYVDSAIRFLAETACSDLYVVYLERGEIEYTQSDQLRGISLEPTRLTVGSTVRDSRLEEVIRLNLREVLWCKLEQTHQFYLHFGYDYYMYVGSTVPFHEAVQETEQADLFVEEMVSPYL